MVKVKPMENIFTLTFGKIPPSYINRKKEISKLCNDFCRSFLLSHVYFITGINASGKTVLLTNVS